MFTHINNISVRVTKTVPVFNHHVMKTFREIKVNLCIRSFFIHSSKFCPLYSGFPSPKTKFRHLSLSLVCSSVSPWFIMLRLTPSIYLSLGLPLLRVPSGSHSKILFICNLFKDAVSSSCYAACDDRS
jgi:hypothetical protein